MGNQKLPILSGREICKILEKHGFQMVSQKGSHIKLKKRLESGKILVTTVPNHNHVSRHLLKTIINQTGLSRKQFLKYIKK